MNQSLNYLITFHNRDVAREPVVKKINCDVAVLILRLRSSCWTIFLVCGLSFLNSDKILKSNLPVVYQMVQAHNSECQLSTVYS